MFVTNAKLDDQDKWWHLSKKWYWLMPWFPNVSFDRHCTKSNQKDDSSPTNLVALCITNGFLLAVNLINSKPEAPLAVVPACMQLVSYRNWLHTWCLQLPEESLDTSSREALPFWKTELSLALRDWHMYFLPTSAWPLRCSQIMETELAACSHLPS